MTTSHNKVLITVVMLLGTVHWCCAQSVFSLLGKVIDDKGDALVGAYIELLVSENAAPIETVTTNHLGEFYASAEKEIRIIRVQYIGFERKVLQAPFSSPLLIKMKEIPSELEEVTVTGQSPSRITKDGIKFSPTKLQKALPNITHYLAQLPFIEKSGSGFAVVGRGAAVVYIDNRKLEDLQELKELKMEDVFSVDVLPNPGAFYDADVRTVIKIRTKGKKAGMGAEFASSVLHSERTEYWNRGKFSYNTPTLSWQSSLAYDHDPTRAQLDIVQLMTKNQSSSVKYNSTEEQLYRNLLLRNSLVYSPNKSNSLGASLTYSYTHWNTDVVNGLHYTDAVSDVEFEQKSNSKSPSHKWTGNLFYNYSDKRWDLLFNTDLYRGSHSNVMASINSDHTVEPNVNTHSESSNFLIYSQAVASYKVSDRINVQFGADYAHTSVSQMYQVGGSHATLSPFDIRTYQHRYASYATVQYALQPISFVVGLRHEALSIKRKNEAKQNVRKLFSRSRLYPSASISMSKKAFQSQLSYSMKTEYPTYNQLRAGLNYSSPYLYEGGNPDLRPETRHELSLLSRYMKSSLMINYTAVVDQIIQVPTLYADNIMLYRPDNHGVNKYLSLSISQRVNWGDFWECALRMDYQTQWMRVAGFTRERGDGYMLKADNTISLSNHVQCFVNGAYRSASENGLFRIPRAWNLDVALNFSLLSDRLNIYLECADVFSTLHGKRTYDGEHITMDYSRNYQTRTFTIYVSYKLSNLISSKKYKGNTTNDEIKRL